MQQRCLIIDAPDMLELTARRPSPDSCLIVGTTAYEGMFQTCAPIVTMLLVFGHTLIERTTTTTHDFIKVTTKQ